MTDRATEVALFRPRPIREAADPALSKAVRAGGFEALEPKLRARRRRVPTEALDMAEAPLARDAVPHRPPRSATSSNGEKSRARLAAVMPIPVSATTKWTTWSSTTVTSMRTSPPWRCT